MIDQYAYRAFGLNIVCDFPLPSLELTGFNVADIKIRHESIAPHLDEDWRKNVTKFKNWEATPGKFLMRIHKVANFLAISGDTLLIERADSKVDDDAVAVFVMGSMLGAILQQRNNSLLHASAVKMNSGAVVFAGKSGAGKSTLALHLMRRGHALIADDVVALSKNSTAQICVTPSFPTLRLWEDAVHKLGCEKSVKKRVRPELDKFLISASEFCDAPQPIIAIYMLNERSQPGIEIKRVHIKDAYHEITVNGYRNGFLKAHRMYAEHFQTMTEVVSGVPIFQIYRPDAGFALDELSDAIQLHSTQLASAA